MKTPLLILTAAITLITCLHSTLNAQSFTVDPSALVNRYTSLGEWNTNGNQDGWNLNNFTAPSVFASKLTATSVGVDPQFVRSGLTLDSSTGDFDIVEIRMRKPPGETTRIDLFWDDSTPGGFSAASKATLAANLWPTDGQFHILQVPLASFFNGTINALRFDPVSDTNTPRKIDIDYIRIGTIDADDDEDGLANAVETNDRNFIDPRNTGTDPADQDSDNDTFLDGLEVANGTNPNSALSFPLPRLSEYTINSATYVVDIPITNNVPLVDFAIPTGFTVAPALPPGISIDPLTGLISGTPTTIAPSATYTVTASFNNGMTSEFDLIIGVNAIPVFLGTDLEPIGNFVSLGEWNTSNSLENWGFTNANGSASAGILTFNATAADPQMIRNNLDYDPADGTTLEIRLRQSDTNSVQIFWGVNLPNQVGAAAGRTTFIPSSAIPTDGQFHTYQISFANVFDANLVLLRLDPGVSAGRSVEIDYVRIGSPGSPDHIKITAFKNDALFGEIELSWTSNSTSLYNIESSPDLNSWAVAIPNLAGDPGSTTFIGDPETSDQFFRVVQQAP